MLKKLIICIEHFGSTAVPGLAAKPVIDLLVECIPSQAKQVAVSQLKHLVIVIGLIILTGGCSL